MKKLYSFYLDYGRCGSVEGLFIADDQEIERIIGREVYFGEILGKHSEVYCDLTPEHFEVKSEDQDFINKLIDILGDGTISGYNPLEYIDEDDYENDEDDED